MNILSRTKLDQKVDSGPSGKAKYLTCMVGGHGQFYDHVVQACFKGAFTVEEIVIFSDTFEGKPALGGLFVCREGDTFEIDNVKVYTKEELAHAVHQTGTSLAACGAGAARQESPPT